MALRLHQRHPKQCKQHDRETVRPSARQLIVHRDGEDDEQVLMR
jgi:hypothetical protein